MPQVTKLSMQTTASLLSLPEHKHNLDFQTEDCLPCLFVCCKHSKVSPRC